MYKKAALYFPDNFGKKVYQFNTCFTVALGCTAEAELTHTISL